MNNQVKILSKIIAAYENPELSYRDIYPLSVEFFDQSDDEQPLDILYKGYAMMFNDNDYTVEIAYLHEVKS